MNHKIRAAIVLACLAPTAAFAEVSLYGRANVSIQQNEESKKGNETQDKSFQSLNSNASRIGLKGTEKLVDAGIDAIYMAEFEASFDDGRSGSANDETLKQRNIYLGIKGGYGTLIGGQFDTPLKKSQNKVDLFNDLRGDIASQITVDELRVKNSVMYTTPTVSGFSGSVDAIASEVDGVDNGTSLSASYENKMFYAALAYDTDVLKPDTTALRAVAQVTFNGFQLGALIDKNNDKIADVDTTGWIASLQYTYEKWAFKGQYGESDMKTDAKDVEVLSLGADYSLSKMTKVYGFYTTEQADAIVAPAKPVQATLDNNYLGIGMEMNF